MELINILYVIRHHNIGPHHLSSEYITAFWYSFFAMHTLDSDKPFLTEEWGADYTPSLPQPILANYFWAER